MFQPTWNLQFDSCGLQLDAKQGLRWLVLFLALQFATLAVRAEDYSTLNASELIEKAEVSAEHDRAAIADRAMQLLLDSKFVEVDTSTLRLIDLAKPLLADLSEEKQRQVAGLLNESAGQPTFEHLQARNAIASVSKQVPSVPAELIEEWVAEAGLENLSIPELAWCYQAILPNEAGRHEFSATWLGNITPPRNGEYKFSISPINVNSQGREHVRHSLSLAIAESEVLRTPKESTDEQQLPTQNRSRTIGPPALKWINESESISLDAGRPVPIKLEMKYSSPGIVDGHQASAILFWEGPGFGRQPVPAEVLGTVEKAGVLHAEFRWQEGANERLVTQEVQEIDFISEGAATVGSQYSKFSKDLANRLFELVTDEKYLNQCEQDDSQHIYVEEPKLANGLTTKQREAFLKTLSTHDKYLSSIAPKEIVQFYQHFRFGVEEQALDVAGQWMHAHADIVPEITLDFFQVNRRPYWHLGRLIGSQLPDHAKILQDRYLVLENGGCVLPVAYAVCYAALQQNNSTQSLVGRPNEFGGWIQLLSDELGNENLSGDLRVNWLLARAQAEECQGLAVDAAMTPLDRVWSGRGWIDEASLVAEKSMERLIQERVARWTALQEWQRAEVEISTSSENQYLKHQIEFAKEGSARLSQQQHSKSNTAFVNEVRRRLALAEQRQDQVTVNQYKQTLESIQE